MNVVLYGAAGNSGSRILTELVSRGHSVTAIARDTSKIPTEVTAKQDDLGDVDTIAALIAGSDAVISAYNPPTDDTDALIGVTERQIAAVRKAGDVRLIVVGGAGSLEVAPRSDPSRIRSSPGTLHSHCRIAWQGTRGTQGIGYQLDLSQPSGVFPTWRAYRRVPPWQK
jgi:putative NADH-flavin reductase